MLRITLDVQTLPNGTTALDLKLINLTARHTANELEAGSKFYEHIATLAAGLANQSGGRISFTPGTAQALEIPMTTLCSCVHDTMARSA